MNVDLKEQLKKQTEFLASSCELYDLGRVNEAIRIATSLRVLFHDTAKSTSLIQHAGVKKLWLLSTCDDIPKHAEFFPNLTKLQLNPQAALAEFIPKLDTAATKRIVPLSTWWGQDVVYLHRSANVRVRRRDLVLMAANKDGGAHVDTTVPQEYQEILEGLGWAIILDPESNPRTIKFKNAHLSALRQMAFEVLNSPALLRLL